MSGWCPSSSACGIAVVCCCCPAQCSGVARALLIPLQCWRVLQCVSCTVAYRVWCCGVGECLCVLFVWWGILCPLPPRRGGGWGHRGRWGVVCGGGWHVGEGRQCWGRAAVLLTPRRMSVSPSACWCPHCRLPCGPIEWRGGGCCDGRLRIGRYLRCPAPSRIVQSPFSLCASCQRHCWFRIVSFVTGLCHCGMAGGRLSFSSLCLPLLLGVGVRGSARAALRARTLSPNTIVSSACCSSSLLFSLFVPRLSSRLPVFFAPRFSSVGMAVDDSPRVTVLCWHDCDG